MSKPSVTALLRHVIIEGFVNAISRQSHLKLVREMERLRPGSFPFVSADTFRSLADVVVEKRGVTRRQKLTHRSIVFFDLAQLSEGLGLAKNRAPLRRLAEVYEELAEAPVLILHNGDKLPDDSVMAWAIESSYHVYSVNVTKDRAGLTSIPVGIENVYRNLNGRLEDFIAFRDSNKAEARTDLVFSSFNIENNREIRKPLSEELMASRFPFDSRRISPAEHRRKTRRAKFILSPPGNGIDCHRTWEAVYLGAVPVVLADYISTDLIRDLPILAVSSFREFLGKSQADLLEEFDRVRKAGTEKAFMPFWISDVLRRANDL